jgi:HD superfamily phosphohydrolase
LADVLWQRWKIRGEEIARLLAGEVTDPRQRILQSILSGPIDIDKMDYLMRDSLHAGVPYGRNFDQARLISSMSLNQAGDGLALTEKGRTAAEMMVFARYVMFSEVYWHHAVRSATAMLQRAFFQSLDRLDLHPLFRLTEQPFIDHLGAAADPPTAELLHGLFGPERRLYKRWAQYSLFERPEIYRRLARQPYPWLARCGTELAEQLARRLQRPVAPLHVLIDAPPRKLEVQFEVEIFDPKQNEYRRLGDVSPVVRTLAETQFDDYVKRVRIFVHPTLAGETRALSDTETLLERAIEATDRYITGAV